MRDRDADRRQQPPPPSEPPPRHYVKATACGNARRNHAVTTEWDEVNCPRCLEQAPFHRNRTR